MLTNHRALALAVSPDVSVAPRFLNIRTSPTCFVPPSAELVQSLGEKWTGEKAAAMAHRRTLRGDYDKTSSVVCVVGSELNINLDRSAPPGSKFFSVKCTANVKYSISPPPGETSHMSPVPLSGNSVLLISMSHASQEEAEEKLSVHYYGKKKDVLGKAVLHLTAVEISLDVDADRDGIVEKNNPNKESWKWGPNGHGAILLVNCDSEKTHDKTPDSEEVRISRVSDLKDMSLMVLRTKGPARLPKGYKLTMHICQGDAESVRVFRAGSPELVKNSLKKLFSAFVKDYPLVLSSEVLSQEVPYLGGSAEINFYVEGLRFPDKDFDGLISINLSLLEPISEGIPETPIFTDKVVFRVSPWIMTPNTLQPLEVFVCSTSDNYQFLKGMKNLVTKNGYKLKVCHEYMNRGDRWMQDELEFGYIDSPHHNFPVVLDSPRDGALDDFPYDVLLGPDFGYVTRVARRRDVSSLDSFGNLEVSPPVTVNGKSYPLGRILIGVAFPTATKGRNMTKVVQDFLWAQKVQEPVALFSDWLHVGHIDEFMTFVPAPDRKGFRLLLASPDAGYKIFRGLHNDGHGQAKMFDGVKNEDPVTVDEILGDENLRAENNYVQSCIDWNRDVLKRELGLDDDDIIDLPILFKLLDEEDEYRAVAYYPDMVNMIVLGKNLGIPKPFGPKVNGRCALEAEMCSLMEGLGLNCTFIDDFASYHKLLGEVHCGSNVRRKPFDFKWWNIEL
ncbi:protein-arginine deiminase type-2-like isoform 1-T1 [Fundulus diaphanus]